MVVQTNKKLPATPKLAAACASPLDALLKPQTFKGWSDPTRVKLFCCLAKCGRGCTVSELAECCRVDLSVVSRHLALLERAQLIRSQREGRLVRYEVDYQATAAWLQAIAHTLTELGPASARGKRKGGCCG